MMLRRRRMHQVTLTLAGLYNLAWGAYAMLDPQWLFKLADMQPMRYPEVFAWLGMVLALYGTLYLFAASNPKGGGAIVAIGLLGKVLGPTGWLWLHVRGDWPLRSGLLILTNDLIWWIPFIMYLQDLIRSRRLD